MVFNEINARCDMRMGSYEFLDTYCENHIFIYIKKQSFGKIKTQSPIQFKYVDTFKSKI